MSKLTRGFLCFNSILIFLAIVLFAVGLFLIFYHESAFAEVQISANELAKAKVIGWGFFSAAISVGLSCIGAGIAVSVVGSAAMGAVSERPELMGRSLIYVGLAEGIAIYGLIVAIMIIGKI